MRLAVLLNAAKMPSIGNPGGSSQPLLERVAQKR
jgi:hypothetical protein